MSVMSKVIFFMILYLNKIYILKLIENIFQLWVSNWLVYNTRVMSKCESHVPVLGKIKNMLKLKRKFSFIQKDVFIFQFNV